MQLDVFGVAPYLGNPLAVVLDADGITDDRMAAIARWTNLSETTFVCTPTDDDADYRVRIWSPFGELPFAGHPTLGTCVAWLLHGGVPRRAGATVQECGAGLVTIRHEDAGRPAFAAPPLVRTGPVAPAVVAEVVEAMGLDPDDVEAAEWIDNGPGWMGLLLRSADAVRAARPGPVVEDAPTIGLAGVAAPDAAVDLEVRAFFPKDGVATEDPVTGSLNAALGQWLIGSGRITAPYRAAQGAALGRDGRIEVGRDDDGQVWVGGAVWPLIDGSIEV